MKNWRALKRELKKVKTKLPLLLFWESNHLSTAQSTRSVLPCACEEREAKSKEAPKSMKRIVSAIVVLLCTLLTLAYASQSKPPHAVLFTFVNKPDKHFSWNLAGTQTAATHTATSSK